MSGLQYQCAFSMFDFGMYGPLLPPHPSLTVLPGAAVNGVSHGNVGELHYQGVLQLGCHYYERMM